MGHLCGSTCKRKTGQPCRTCRTPGGARVVQLDARSKPVNPPNGQYRQATPHEKGAVADLYFDGVSYRRTAKNMGEYFGRDMDPTVVYKRVRDLSKRRMMCYAR